MSSIVEFSTEIWCMSIYCRFFPWLDMQGTFMHNLIRVKELFIKSQISVHNKLNTSESCICILLMNLITQTNINKTIAISLKML